MRAPNGRRRDWVRARSLCRPPPADAALDLARDLRVQGEDVVELAVEVLTPELFAVLRPNQVGTHPDPVTGGSHARLEQIVRGLLRRAFAFLGELLRSVG